MSSLEIELRSRLEELRAQNLYRELREVDSAQGPRIRLGKSELLNFSSNDYLGLANEPALREAAIKAIERFGAGSGASRLICGSLKPHHELDEAIARFKGAEAALSFSSGYATALGTICALLSKDDVIIIDKLVHASIVDAARLCGAKLRVFAHNNLESLEAILQWANARQSRHTTSATVNQPALRSRVLIVTESVFSMDGELAPLRDIVELKERHGAWLMVDEAHATGLFGEKRRGLAEAHEISESVDIQMGTLGKAVGSAGGYICGSRVLIDYLVNRARSLIFSTAPSPASAAAAKAGIEFIESKEGDLRRDLLWARVDDLKNSMVGGKWKVPVVRSPIIPVMVGDETAATDLAAGLRARGIFIPAIRYPTVARGQARLRLTVTAAHKREEVEGVAAELQEIGETT
ncbi:MAG TPA: 8-amino-7-oxononanoate synthase [Verrucomicrobiae bacterium]